MPGVRANSSLQRRASGSRCTGTDVLRGWHAHARMSMDAQACPQLSRSPMSTPAWTCHPADANAHRHRGFTLMELMVAVGLVVMLMVAVSFIFKMTSETVGLGETVALMTRDQRNVQGVMEDDFKSAVRDGPIFLIYSNLENVLDENGNVVLDADDLPIKRRIDQIRFFRRGMLDRQTADDGEFASDTRALDGYVSYGIARQDVPVQSYNPATDLTDILARNVILLRDEQSINETHIRRRPSAPVPWSALYLSPLTPGSIAYNPNPPPPGTDGLTQSRYDLAGTTLEQFRVDVLERRARVVAGGGNPDVPGDDYDPDIPLPYPVPWWGPLLTIPGAMLEPSQPTVPFVCQPNPPVPLNSDGLAKASPLLLENVKEFIVEFAGDFVKQNSTTGAVDVVEPDGTLDFDVDPVTQRKRIRWYGFPRVDEKVPNGSWPNTVDRYRDVVPVWVFSNGTTAPFERVVPGLTLGAGDNVVITDNYPYVAIWVNDSPAMIRIRIHVEDPNNRLADGKWYEYVFSLR
jgi:prepilin-type N-terminal cleavage/methylation domain-containing protein